MTNFEYYKEEVNKITNEGHGVAIVKGKPVDCCSIDNCEVCLLYDTVCSAGLVKWLYQEYAPYVDWNKVKIDTPIFVSNDGENWHPRYFAKYENDKIYAFQAGATSWSNKSHPVSWKCAKLKEVE